MDSYSKDFIDYPILDTLKLSLGETYFTVGDTLCVLVEEDTLSYRVSQYSYYENKTNVLILNTVMDSDESKLDIVYFRY